MKKRIINALILFIFIICLLYLTYKRTKSSQLIIENPSTTAGVSQLIDECDFTIKSSDVKTVKTSEEEIDYDRLEMAGEIEVVSEPLVFPDSYYDPETETYREEDYWDDMELVALVCVAEAEGESELGKRLVIDSIFNRAESPYFPNTIHNVVYAQGQFECTWNGRLDHVEYDEYIANLVIEELNNRTNSEVIYFKTGGYFGFGTPLLQEGSHYFSGR